jgi:hypothetical protein
MAKPDTNAARAQWTLWPTIPSSIAKSNIGPLIGQTFTFFRFFFAGLLALLTVWRRL